MNSKILVFDFDPVPKGRPRLARGGYAYTPEKTRTYEKRVESEARKQWTWPPLEGPLEAEVYFYFKKPKSAKRDFPSVKPDCDNLVKAIFDPCEKANVFLNDSQIVTCIIKKRYTDQANGFTVFKIQPVRAHHLP